MKKSLLDLIWDQKKAVLPVTTADLSGKTVIVVGATTTSIGYEAAKHFANMNAERIILACRNVSRGEAAVHKLKTETGVTAELWLLDLSKFSSVIDFADKFKKDGGRLDLLIANAGVATSEYEKSPEGWESTIQVNHLSTSLLCILLLPHLISTAKTYNTTPRLVVVSSDTHYLANLREDALNSPKILERLSDETYCTHSIMRERYPLTKLLNIFFVRALDGKLSSSIPVIVNAVTPGACASDLGKREGESYVYVVLRYLVRLTLARTIEEGSRQLVWAAVSGEDKLETMRGSFVMNQSLYEVSDYVLSKEGQDVQERIWNETVEILEKVAPFVRTIIKRHLVDD